MTVATKTNLRRSIGVGNQDVITVAKNDSCAQREISVFSTEFGWFGLLGEGGQLVSTFVGHPTSKSVRAAAARQGEISLERDWAPSIRQMFVDYTNGEIVDFASLSVCLPAVTGFRRQVLQATRRLRYGETVTYGELAERVGHPGAARAVGTVMSTNRFPILIPCHRVLAAGGKLGGYTSPSGTDFKLRLLDLEARAAG